jgi:type IV pilus assembly protein PilO
MEVGAETQAKLDRLAKLPKAVRLSIVGGLAILIGCGYYFGLYQDRAAELERLRSQELGLQRKLSEVRSIAANIAEFEVEIAHLEHKLKLALRQLPNKKELEVLLTDISNLGKKAGVEIRSFERNEEVIHDFYAEVPIDIKLDGEYHNIGKFFELMSKLKRIVNMGALTITISRESLDSTRLAVSGTATAFRFVGNDTGA